MELRSGGLDGRQIRAELGLDENVGVPGFLAGQPDYLVDDLVEVDLTDRRIGLTRKAQQLVRDFLATVALCADLADRAPDLLEVLGGAWLALTEQVVDPARLLHHDGHRVVDLVSDAGGKLADRSESPGLDDLVSHHISVVVGFCKSLGEVARYHIAHEHRGERDNDQYDDRKLLDASKLGEGVRSLLLITQEPLALFERCDGED